MNPKPSLSIESAIRSGVRSSSKPSASSTSALPDCRRDRPVAVLRDARARSGCDERCRSRDVERLAAVAARPRGVDEVVALRAHRDHVRAHRLGAPAISSAVSPFSRSATRKPPICAGRRLAGHDRAHHVARLGPRSGPRRRAAVRARPGSSLRSEEVLARCRGRAGSAPTRDGTVRRRPGAPGAARPSPRRRARCADTSKTSGTDVAASEW